MKSLPLPRFLLKFKLVPFIKNNHISLRAVEKEDLAFLYRIENDASVRQFGSSLMPHSKYVIKEFITNAHQDIYAARQLRFVIEHNDTCAPIGMIDLFDFEPHHQRAAVGIWLAEEFREQLLGKEALESLINYAFDILQMEQLYCHVAADNTKSLHFFKKSGFLLCGNLKHWYKTKEGFTDACLLQLHNQKDKNI